MNNTFFMIYFLYFLVFLFLVFQLFLFVVSLLVFLLIAQQGKNHFAESLTIVA